MFLFQGGKWITLEDPSLTFGKKKGWKMGEGRDSNEI